jgi:hypothetical protein
LGWAQSQLEVIAWYLYSQSTQHPALLARAVSAGLERSAVVTFEEQLEHAQGELPFDLRALVQQAPRSAPAGEGQTGVGSVKFCPRGFVSFPLSDAGVEQP